MIYVKFPDRVPKLDTLIFNSQNHIWPSVHRDNYLGYQTNVGPIVSEAECLNFFKIKYKKTQGFEIEKSCPARKKDETTGAHALAGPLSEVALRD